MRSICFFHRLHSLLFKQSSLFVSTGLIVELNFNLYLILPCIGTQLKVPERYEDKGEGSKILARAL